MKKTLIACLGLSVALIGCANDAEPSSDDPADDSGEQAGDPNQDGAADSLAADRGISLTEAQVRMSWQDKLDDLEDALVAQMGGSYGGMWIDPDHGDRIQVAMTDDAAAADVMLIAQQVGVDAGTDVVRVKRSRAQLQSIVDNFTAKVGETEAAIDVDEAANVIALTLPSGALSPALQGAVDELVRTHGDAIELRAPVDAAPSATSFSPPFRGGVLIIDDAHTIACTAGFFAHHKSSNAPTVLTAGHCAGDAGGTWDAFFSTGSKHGLTNGGQFELDAGGDMAALRMINVAGWKPKPWIVVHSGPSTSYIPRYTISGNAISKPGRRVCHTGITTGTHCGTILHTNQPITYDHGKTTIGHQVEVKMCGDQGDSGGPVVSQHKAMGTYSATGATNKCISYYQPIAAVERQLKVAVAHCKGAGATTDDAESCCSLSADHSRSNSFLTCQ
ncbi:MAG TPA: S1 family peptidase [Kofleriaceae bacterium]